MSLQRFNPVYREDRLNAALQKAQAFALQQIAPTTEPNTGSGPRPHATVGTPRRYSVQDEAKRSYQLGFILLESGQQNEGLKIMSAALAQFPVGNAGQDGSHASEPSALILSSPLLR
jgi:hypothetical protein